MSDNVGIDTPRGPTPTQTWSSLPLGSKAATLIGGAAVIMLLFPIWAFVASIFGPSPPVPNSPNDPQKNAKDRAAELSKYVAQITGRSMFHDPAAPVAAAPPADSGPSKPPPPPTTYGGPGIIAMINGTVWFSDGKRLKAGDEAKDDLEVKAVNAPWDATVVWKGVEFKVELFARNRVVFKDPPATGDLTPVVKAAPFEPAPEKPPAAKPPEQKDPPKPPEPGSTGDRPPEGRPPGEPGERRPGGPPPGGPGGRH